MKYCLVEEGELMRLVESDIKVSNPGLSDEKIKEEVAEAMTYYTAKDC